MKNTVNFFPSVSFIKDAINSLNIISQTTEKLTNEMGIVNNAFTGTQ